MSAERTYDLNDFVESVHHVKLLHQLNGNMRGPGSEFSIKLAKIEEWVDSHCEGKYIILLESVIFTLKADALIFKLGYNYD